MGGTAWYEATYPYPDKLIIDLNGYFDGEISCDFAGRGRVGNLCGGSDSYMVFDAGNGKVTVDVWGAYRASVWSSSTTVKVYIQSETAGTSTRAYVGPSGFNRISKETGFDAPVACPTTLQATVTINDNGSISIA